MARIVKTADERRIEIINTSEKLFSEKGFANTSVESIIKEIGVAKGTFYYYFKSKEEVLKAIVDLHLEKIVTMAEQVADEKSLDALSKMRLLLGDSNMGNEDTKELVEHIHLPGNRELHEGINIQTVLRLSPVFAKIIEQGNDEKIFHVERPLETFQLLLSGGQFLLDGGLFTFSDEEIRTRQIVLQDIVEKVLGVEKGLFKFMVKK